MRSFNAILLLFMGVLYLNACEAKCRGKNAAKLRRSLKLAISSDNINNRHKAGLRKIFRRKRDTNDEEVIESDKFTAEIKFLQKWNPAMSQKDGSAYRLFQGNVLDAILEQMNADRRFINSHVLDLKETSDGILAKVGFHFRKSEHNPISHIRFVVSHGHLSSLKVDKHYFKILKTPAKFGNEHDDSKTATQQKQSTNAKQIQKNVSKQESNQNSATQQAQNEPPPASASSQSQVQPDYPSTGASQNQDSVQDQATNANNQEPQIQTTQDNIQPPQPQVTTQQQTQAGDQQQNQNSVQNQDNAQVTDNQDTPKPAQSQDQNAAQVTTQQQTQAGDQLQNQNSVQNQDNAQVTDNQYPSNQPQAPYQPETTTQQKPNSQDENVAVYQPADQSNTQLTQTTPNPSPNPSNSAQIQNDQSNDPNQNQPNPKPEENTSPQVSSEQEGQVNQESASVTKDADEENISIKMNQAWFPFLSNHETPQYKMLTGNLEKGLKSVMEDVKTIKDIKVKNLLQADEGHTTVEFLLKFNGDKEGTTEKLREIVKTGDIAGISVDSKFFKIEDSKN